MTVLTTEVLNNGNVFNDWAGHTFLGNTATLGAEVMSLVPVNALDTRGELIQKIVIPLLD